MKPALDPRERDYQIGDTEKVFVKGQNDPLLAEVKVVGFEGGKTDPRRPIFRVIGGPMEGRELHSWHITYL